MSNLGIITYESFFSFIDKDSTERSLRELNVKLNQGYGQVFLAQSNQIENIFFQADVNLSIDGGTQNSQDLTIQVVQLSQSGSSLTVPTFTVDNILLEITAEDCVRLARNSNEATEDSYWYTYNSVLDNITPGSYYGVFFTSTNVNGTPKIYFSDDYRSDVFPQIVATTATSSSWLNSNFSSGTPLYGGGRKGGLCCGFLGNTVEEGGDAFSSGEVNVGGTDARRGYRVFLYAVKTDNDVSLKFSQSSPETPSDGSSEETNRSSMSWYWYSEGTMPISNNPSLLNDTSVPARLEGSSGFVLFTQPDKFSPYPKLYFPETALNLKEKKLDTHFYNQGYTDRPVEGQEVGGVEPLPNGVSANILNDFSHDQWGHFSEKKLATYNLTTGDIEPSTSVNPNYLDVILENESEDVEQVFTKTLTEADEIAGLRGFGNVVKYRDKYVAFSKYRTEPGLTLITGAVSTGLMENIPIVVTSDLTSDDWDDEYMQVTKTGGDLEGCRYIGVFDAMVKNTTSGETLFILMQVAPDRDDDATNQDHAYFELCVCSTDYNGSGDLDFVSYGSTGVKPSDAFFGGSRNATERLVRNYSFDESPNNTDREWFISSGSNATFIGTLSMGAADSSVMQCIDAIAGREYIVSLGAVTGDISSWTFSLGNCDEKTGLSASESFVLVPKDSSGQFVVTAANGDVGTLASIDIKEATTKYNLSDNIINDPYLENPLTWTATGGAGTWEHTASALSPYENHYSIEVAPALGDSTEFALEYNNSEVTIEAGKIYRLVLKVSGMDASITAGHNMAWEMKSSDSGLSYVEQEDGNVESPYTFLEYGFLIYGGSSDRSATDVLKFNVERTTTQGNGSATLKIHNIMLFEVEKKIDVDHKSAKFIESSDGRYLLYTASNHGFTNGDYQQDYSGGKFGLWKIDLLGETAGVFSISGDSVSELFPTRGFRPSTGFNSRKREPEITYVYKYGNSVYYGTTTEGGTITSGYGYDFDPQGYIGEVFVAENINNFREILSGDRNQYWLIGYATGDPTVEGYNEGLAFPSVDYGWSGSALDLDLAVRPHYYNLNRNTKVVYMIRVNNILHVWMSQYMDYHGYGHPFHIAIDINTNIPKVLRRFPIDATGDFVDGTNDDWGISGLETEDVPASNVINDLSNVTTSKAIYNITSGVESGDQIYICGTGPDATGTSHVNHDCVKWLIYDKRTINDAYNYSDLDYVVISTSLPVNDPVTDVSSFAEKAFVARDQFAKIEVDSSSTFELQYGNYDGVSIGKYYYSERQREIYDYPATNVTLSNPRVGIYCGSIISQRDDGLYEEGEFNSRYLVSRYNVNPRLIVQGGVTYLICDNMTDGIGIYKTYGLKVNPKFWGIENSDETDYNLSVDESVEIQCAGRYTSTMKNVDISEIDGIHFISNMKRDKGIVGLSFSDDKERFIGRFTIGTEKPQNMSFYYQFNYMRDGRDSGKNHDDGTILFPNNSENLITTKMITELQSTGLMNIVMKSAPTFEKLWTDPNSTNIVPFELAFYSNRMPEPDYTSRFLCHHTFQTDISDTFFRFESSALATPYDDGLKIFGDDHDAGLDYWDSGSASGSDNTAQVGIPYAEVLVKGISFSSVDLPFEDEGKNQKTLAITGIVNDGVPGEIVDNGVGVEVTGGDEIVIDFPTHLFLNEISFDVVAEDSITGDSNSQFDFYYLSQSTIHKLNINAVHDADWNDMGSISFDPADYNNTELLSGVNVKLDAINTFAKTLKIYVNSGIKFKIRNLQIKTFASSGLSTQFNKGNGVGNAELIVVDDIHGLISGKYSDDVDVASYAEFKREGAYVEIDLDELKDDDGNTVGDGDIPINKISLNIIGGLGRNVKIETKNRDSATYETSVYDDRISDYEYTIVEWTPRDKIESHTIDVIVATDSTNLNIDEVDPYGSSLNGGDNPVLVSSNYSQYFGSGALRGFLFRPSITKSRNATVINSMEYASGSAFDGTLNFNAQMDEYGPFSSDQGEAGVIERSTQVEFPVQDVEKVKITVYGFSDDNMEPVRINGFKVYTPIIDGDGIAVWPQPSVTWDIVLRAQTISSV